MRVDDQALMFKPLIKQNGQPDMIVKDEQGSVFLQLDAPQAKQVSFVVHGVEYECHKKEDGIWQGEFPQKSGFCYVQMKVDGLEILTPYLPIGYGYSRPYNYVELEEDTESFYSLKEVPHGSVRREYFFAETTGEWDRCMVYTPPCYDQNPDTQYPVLYLQHGHGENENGWTFLGKVNFILDNLLAEGKITPFVVVMCNGMVQKKLPEGRIVDFGAFEDLLVKDVIPFIEKKYHVGGDKSKRAMAGLSMGSLQTSIIGFHHAELFSSLGIFSGFVTDILRGSDLDMTGNEKSLNKHLAILEDAEAFAETFDVVFRAMGEEDQFMPAFLHDDSLLEEKGIRHIRKIYPGKHEWNVWRACIRDFSQLIFK